VPMLSTEKAYTPEALQRFVERVHKEAGAIGVAAVVFKVTPKLDGLAGRDDGDILASRGNGEVGYEISSVFEKGVIPLGGRGLGLGEIVISSSYFEQNLIGQFEHPRNMVVGIVSSDTLNDFARKALADRAVHFVPYVMLPAWTGKGEDLVDHIESIMADLTDQLDYPVDGVVVEVSDERIKAHMGATAHHYRWQVAVKTKGDTATTFIERLTWQVGRTGNVTPVMEVKAVPLSGATIRRVTAHNAGLVAKAGIGPGAEIEIIRSGEVIPKLEKVITPTSKVELPQTCPACETPLIWKNDFLKCPNELCAAQVEQRLHHWFKTLGTADWFGIKTIKKIVAGGYDHLEKIYAMTENDFSALGFGPVQSKNLAAALDLSRSKAVEDWRFLAAFGIPDLGTGDSRKLLAQIELERLLDIEPGHIEAINGFGPVTSASIAEGLAKIRDTIRHMLALGFQLQITPLLHTRTLAGSPIANKGVVFTGKMVHGSREQMQAEARRLGALVQSAVGRNTDLLVCGEKTGAKKIEQATRLGVRILSEADYRALLAGSGD
jgi:DNA ligase (NAD+)